MVRSDTDGGLETASVRYARRCRGVGAHAELEALEKVTEKTDKWAVFGGLDGVMKQLVSLKR
jgi:hypothetical protein